MRGNYQFYPEPQSPPQSSVSGPSLWLSSGSNCSLRTVRPWLILSKQIFMVYLKTKTDFSFAIGIRVSGENQLEIFVWRRHSHQTLKNISLRNQIISLKWIKQTYFIRYRINRTITIDISHEFYWNCSILAVSWHCQCISGLLGLSDQWGLSRPLDPHWYLFIEQS